MKIEMRATGEVRPYDRNPRVNAGAVGAVAGSLREFGFRQPIVVDAEGVIVVGHTRWLAARQLGLDRVPVHVAHDLDPVKARAYRIADTATAAIAEWDADLLPIELEELEGLDFDLSPLGFSDDDPKEWMPASVRPAVMCFVCESPRVLGQPDTHDYSRDVCGSCGRRLVFHIPSPARGSPARTR